MTVFNLFVLTVGYFLCFDSDFSHCSLFVVIFWGVFFMRLLSHLSFSQFGFGHFILLETYLVFLRSFCCF